MSWLTGPVPTPNAAPPGAPSDEGADADVAALGYEQARDELVTVVARLEAGVGTLEESLALWERGELLAARCQQWLDGARERLTTAHAPAVPAGADRPGPSAPDDETRNTGSDEGRRSDRAPRAGRKQKVDE